MKIKRVLLELEYEPEKVDKKHKSYKGGIKEPQYTEELHFDVFEDYDFDDMTDEFIPNGKQNIKITGSERALYELGKYFINISQYETSDIGFHVHMGDICNSEGKKSFNVSIHK